MIQFRLSFIGVFAILAISIFSCKEVGKQKIDRLPSINMEDIENIINFPEANPNGEAITKDGANLKIIERTFDFGIIEQGDIIKHKFKIKNTGKKELIILNITSSCGCTVAEKPKAPIQPNNESFVEVIFDSKGKIGKQSRKISIFTNSYPGEDYLELIGIVKD